MNSTETQSRHSVGRFVRRRMKTQKHWIMEIAAGGEDHECACVCDRCKDGRETFLIPRDIAAIQADALRHAAEILFDDHWSDHDVTSARDHLINEARELESSNEKLSHAAGQKGPNANVQ